ncbi:MAG: hypothetical protein ACYDH9_15325 [Limisphaerales bacterium]
MSLLATDYVNTDKPTRVSRNKPARQGLAGLLIGLFIFVQVLAVSSPLHGFFHRDAAAATHACVVTLLAHGHVLLPFCAIQVPPPAFSITPFAATPVPTVVSSDYRLLPGRAPPVGAVLPIALS